MALRLASRLLRGSSLIPGVVVSSVNKLLPNTIINPNQSNFCTRRLSTNTPLVSEYASKAQTPVSLRTLMETGRGDLLGRGGNSFEESSDKNLSTATDLVLMQVRGGAR